jgi:hypothetical protein
VIHNIGKNFILHSEESISGLLSKTQLRTLEATHDSMLGNRAVSWLFGSNVADAIATLPSRLEHVKDHQQKEFDEKFLQNIANLRSIFGRYLRETSPLDWESHEFLLGNVSMPQLSCNNRYKVFSDTGLTPGAHNLRKVRAVHRIVLEPISKSGRGKRSVLPRSGKLQKLLAMKAEVVYFQGHLASLVRELKSISSSLRMHRERQQPAFRLHTLLENCERSLCQEPRDKVYGLLGLASNVDDGEVAVDYSKPLLELYMDTIAHYGAFQKAESPATNGTDLVRFGQLLQRSLSGPFPYPPKNKALETIAPSLAKPAIKVAGYISGPILPLEPIRNIETPTDTTNQERMAILKNYFRGSVDMFVLSDDISKTLSQLRVVERDRVIPNSTSGNSTPSQLKNHLRLFSEASGLIGIAASNIREDDLLCLFAKCDIACVVRPVENHYKIISRAVVAKRFGEKEQKVSSYSPELFQHHVPDPSELEENNRVLFEVDALTLQELTCPTSSMRREYNFNTVEKSKLEADR